MGIWCYLTLQAIRIRPANMLNLSRSGFNQQTLRISPTSSDVDMGVVQRHATKIEKLDGWIDALTNFMNPSVKKKLNRAFGLELAWIHEKPRELFQDPLSHHVSFEQKKALP